MKYLIPVILILASSSCRKKTDTVCPASLTGAYNRSTSQAVLLGGSCTITISDSTDNYLVIRKTFPGNPDNVFYVTVNCDSNTFIIPAQHTEISIFNQIYGTGHIYGSMIVLNYSLYDHVEYNRWFDGCVDTLRR